jgi:hypothetical protein
MVFRRSGFSRVVTLPLGAMAKGVYDPRVISQKDRRESGSRGCDKLRRKQSRLARLREDAHQSPLEVLGSAEVDDISSVDQAIDVTARRFKSFQLLIET